MKYHPICSLLLLASALTGASSAQTFEISSQSGFVYFPSPEGPGIPGCQANDFRCDFGISGTITIEADAAELTFVAANLQLAGNQSIQDNPPYPAALVTVERVAGVLTSGAPLPLVSEVAGVRTYEVSAGFSALTAVVDGDEFRLTGGRDSTPVDGDGYTFDVATTIVPEPATVLMAASLALLLVGRFPRR